MAEEPKKVLPQQRVAALARIVEVRADEAVHDKKRARQHHRRHGEDDHEGGDQHRPDEERHPVQRHAGRAHLEDGGDDDDRGEQPGQLAEGDHLRPDVGALAGTVFRPGERHVAEPAVVGANVERERGENEDPPEEIDPVGESVHAWKSHRARADHERHEIDRHALHYRDGEEEHHYGAVGGKELVVKVRPDQRVLRLRELQAHRRREQPAEREEDEGSDQIALADALVVDGTEPAGETRRIAPGALQDGVHCSPVRYESNACRSSGAMGLAGMFTPGLMPCGSRIQPARWPTVFGTVPAASVPRLARCVRSGARRALALVPWIAWHMTQVPARKTSRPRFWSALEGSGADLRCAAAQRSYSSSAMTTNAIFACWAPQNSAHCPR